jgi:hypothetical protein
MKMQHIAECRAVGRAGDLVQYWKAGDHAAVVQCISALTEVGDLQDVIVAILILRDLPQESVRDVTYRAKFEEAVSDWPS